MRELFEQMVVHHKDAVDKTFENGNIEKLENITREILKAFKAGRKLLICGNGGSASDAQHIAAEFVGRFHRERKSLPAIALTTDTSILTAVANDYDYSQVFTRQVEGIGVSGDILVAISTSGNSKNVIEAVQRATMLGITTVGFTGADGGALKAHTDICFHAGTDKTPHIQEMHITALQGIAEVVESVLFGS